MNIPTPYLHPSLERLTYHLHLHHLHHHQLPLSSSPLIIFIKKNTKKMNKKIKKIKKKKERERMYIYVNSEPPSPHHPSFRTHPKPRRVPPPLSPAPNTPQPPTANPIMRNAPFRLLLSFPFLLLLSGHSAPPLVLFHSFLVAPHTHTHTQKFPFKFSQRHRTSAKG